MKTKLTKFNTISSPLLKMAWTADSFVAVLAALILVALSNPRSASAGLAETKKLTASDWKAGHRFGSSVAISGNTVVVCAGCAAYVFERVGASWSEKKLIPDDASTSVGAFGRSVAISGD